MFIKATKRPTFQRLRQKHERDCGVCVFAELADVSYENVCEDLPGAHLGSIAVDGWTAWLTQRGFTVSTHKGCPSNFVPCVHLVAVVDDQRLCHWIYRDVNGYAHDPSQAMQAMLANDPKMTELAMYQMHILTLSVVKAL